MLAPFTKMIRSRCVHFATQPGWQAVAESKVARQRAQDEPYPSLPGSGKKAKETKKRTVTVYRVEGKGNERVLISDDGEVEIPIVRSKKGKGQERNLYLNCGDEKRAKQFLEQRRKQFEDNEIKSFDVDADLIENLRQLAVKEQDRSQYPDKPVIADPTKASDQFGLGQKQIEALRKAILPRSVQARR